MIIVRGAEGNAACPNWERYGTATLFLRNVDVVSDDAISICVSKVYISLHQLIFEYSNINEYE